MCCSGRLPKLQVFAHSPINMLCSCSAAEAITDDPRQFARQHPFTRVAYPTTPNNDTNRACLVGNPAYL